METTVAPLTPGQAAVLFVIIEWIEQNKVPPTLREIADKLGKKSRHPVQLAIKGLTDKGYVSKEPNKARNYSVNRYPDGTEYIPEQRNLQAIEVLSNLTGVKKKEGWVELLVPIDVWERYEKKIKGNVSHETLKKDDKPTKLNRARARLKFQINPDQPIIKNFGDTMPSALPPLGLTEEKEEKSHGMQIRDTPDPNDGEHR